MNINRENYQEYAMEWLEGTLGAAEHKAFVQFLEDNPDILRELDELMETDLLSPEASFSDTDFSMLKRSINEKEINTHNYPEFLIARRDGELDAVSLLQLESWLQQHPELHREVSALEATFLQPDAAITFPHKDQLNHQVTIRGGAIQTHQLEELIIASMEGELSEADQQQLDQYLETHPEAADLQIAFRLTRLSPDTNVVFAGKGDLKRRAVVPMMITRTSLVRGLAVAASLALLAGIFLSNPADEEVIIVPVVETASETTLRNPQDPVTPPAVAEKATSKGTAKAVKPNRQNSVHPEVPLAENRPATDPSISVPKHALRPSGSLMNPLSVTTPTQLPNTAMAYQHNTDPATHNSRLTVNEFPVEQIRYFTGGGNERPGLLAELTIPRLIELTNPYERINNAGQQLITRWNRWKEQAIDEVVPYR